MKFKKILSLFTAAMTAAALLFLFALVDPGSPHRIPLLAFYGTQIILALALFPLAYRMLHETDARIITLCSGCVIAQVNLFICLLMLRTADAAELPACICIGGIGISIFLAVCAGMLAFHLRETPVRAEVYEQEPVFAPDYDNVMADGAYPPPADAALPEVRVKSRPIPAPVPRVSRPII